MIRKCTDADFNAVWNIINDGAQAYVGHISQNLLHDPYMSQEELRAEIGSGVEFWASERDGIISGVMGLQHVRDVILIRHAYVRTKYQGSGIGSALLLHLRSIATGPVLIGTWADAKWAIAFYVRHGFQLLGVEEKVRLLKKYWTVPERQIEASVVLADAQWMAGNLRVMKP